MQAEGRASSPVLGSQAIKPSTSLAVLIARLLHARYVDQCKRRLNTTTSRHASAPQSPAVKAAVNAGGRSEASALRRATRVWRRFLFRFVSFGEQAHGLLILRILAVPEKGLVHRLTWPEIEGSLAGKNLVSSRTLGLLIIFRRRRL